MNIAILSRAKRAAVLLGALWPLAPVAGAQSASSERSVTLRFKGVVGERPFVCGERYERIGASDATVSVSDFRLYVQDVRFITADGGEVAMQLANDSLWQHANVALLDFEDAKGPCSNGTPELRDVVTGTVPNGNYTGVRFELGVPFALNHADLATLPAPLALTRMFWAWNSGHKFMRVDLRTTPAMPTSGDTAGPTTWMIHLGSTNCIPSTSMTTVPTSCAHPNRATVTLDAFDPEAHVILADLAALLAKADVLKNQEKTAAGCMSSQQDADCAPLFAALGLRHEKLGGAKPVQRFFRAVATMPADAPNNTGGLRP